MKPSEHRDRRQAGRSGVLVRQGGLNPDLEPPAERAGGSPGLRRRLKPSIEVFPASTGDVYLMRPDNRPDLVVRSADDADRTLLAVLAERSATRTELAVELERRGVAILAETLEGKLAALVRCGATRLEADPREPLPEPDAERFSRQLPYFAETGDPSGAQRELRAATVVVLGCGGLGTWALGALACTGVGSFLLIDDDSVDLSNLNRQILFAQSDLGEAKVERAADWVRRFDATIEVRTVKTRISGPSDLAPLLDGADVLILAADWPPYELVRWVNDVCVDARVPYIVAGQVPPTLKVGPTYVPGRSACFDCHERALRRGFPLYEELTRFRRAHPTPATTLGPASGAVGALLAMEVMHLLTGDGPVATEGRAFLLDMRSFETRWEAIERDPSCPSCNHLA